MHHMPIVAHLYSLSFIPACPLIDLLILLAQGLAHRQRQKAPLNSIILLQAAPHAKIGLDEVLIPFESFKEIT